MNKARGLSIIAITLLILQMFSVNFGMGTISKAANNDSEPRVEVKSKSVDDDTLTWEVAVSALSEEGATAKTNISFSSGQSHKAIDHKEEITADQTKGGYVIETPADGTTYKVDLTTKVTNESQEKFQLSAETELDGNTYNDEAQVEVERKVEEGEKTLEKMKDNGNKTEEKADAKEDTNNNESLENIIAQLKAKPLNQFKEAEIRKLVGGLSEDELEQVLAALGQEEEMGVIDPNFKPFAMNKSMRGLSTMSTPSWPAPGSVNLNGKDAKSTDNYGEWEIELSVEAKDIDTTKTTDIVLVFDRSGSMQGNRLTKAKEAARQFVNELLTDGSQTRIAVVTFSDSYQTLAGGFRGVSGKQNLLNAINGISATGGTNIQGGLRHANNLIANTEVQNKIIVLLSDGAPTYSYKATSIANYNWPYGNYDRILSSFGSERLGNGSDYNLPTGFLGFGDQRYRISGYRVTTNGLPTISEAKHIMNNGINMYSIGLDVGNDNNAMNVLRNSQNKGAYFGTGSDLDPIFAEIAGQIKHAATSAVVTDPLGDMFNLVKNKYGNGVHFTASQGNVTWNDATETFTWNIGIIKEGEKPTLKYTVTIDWENPDLKGHVDYPMNKETPLNYKDVDGNSAVKYFDIPKGQIDKGKIKRVGYRVNPAGDPLDESGNVVASPDLAEQFYDEYYGDFHDFGSINIPAKAVADYTVIVGDDPTTITLEPSNPVQTVLFGYVKTSDMVAGDVTAHYQDEEGNTVATSETYTGNIGATYTTVQKDIPGYEFVEVDPNGAPASGTFTQDPQTVTYIYKQLLGSITVNKVDEKGNALPEAEFTLTGSNGYEETRISYSDGKIVFDQLEWGTYTLRETKAPNGYRLSEQEIVIEINSENLTFEQEIKNTKQGWDIPNTGGIGSLGFLGAGFMLMAGAGWFVYRRRYV